MSADEEQQCLSAEELRKRLYQSFKRKGVLDSVKTQLRNQLIRELQRESLPQAQSPDQSYSLSLLASNSLVIDHLQRSGYEYTLSVFYPECGISKEKVFSTKDILGLLRISPHSPVYTNLVTDLQNGNKGLLLTLLSELIAPRLQSSVCDSETQTTDTPDYRQSIMKKMQVIDEEYEALRLKGQCWGSVEQKLTEYRKELEEQAEEQLKSKIQLFQEVDISRVRMEEREKCRQELLEAKRQLERNYQMKLEALMNREKNAIDRLQKQQQIEESELFSQRQTLLKEIQSVQNRETEFTLRMENFQKSCKLQEEKLRSSEELLRKRELDVRKMEETYELKLNTEIRKHQLELKEDYSRRTEALTENENRNKEETMRIQREAALLNAKREEYERVNKELTRVQEALDLSHGNVCVLVQENAALKQRLEGASDYITIRDERLQLHTEVCLLKRQLQDSQEEKQRLRQELTSPSPAFLTLQAEVKRLEAAQRLDQEDFQNQKQVLHSQLRQEAERCGQLQAQLLECEERTKWMSKHTEQLKQQLRHTQQALEHEVLRNPKLSVLVDRSALDPNPVTELYTEGYHDNLSDLGIATRGHCCPLQTEGEEMVTEALNRIRELEKEADTLDEAYRRFKQKGVVSHIPFKGTSTTPPHIPVTILKSIGTAKNVEDVYAGTDLNRHPPGHMTPPTVGSPPIRRLSSTPVSITARTKPRGHTEPGTEVIFSGLGSEREVSPIPAATAEEYTHITPPRSPRLKSAARDNCSPPKLHMTSSSSQESSPQPDKISILDLTQPQADREAFQYGSVEQLEETHTNLEQHDVVQSAAGQKHKEEEEERRMEEEGESTIKEVERRIMEEEERLKEGEEKRMIEEEERGWQEERRVKEEWRQREIVEAQERRELERFSQGDLLHREEEEDEGSRGRTETRAQGPEVKTEDKAGDNQDDPLHKYMLMVMQGREREREEIVKRDESETSPEPVVLSDHKDDSITAFSNDDPNDDFW